MNLRDLFLAMNLGGGSGGSGGGNYTLPVASPTVLGGVKPTAKSDDMTEPVGVDASGKLFTKPGGGGGGEEWETIAEIEVAEETTLFKYTLNKKYSAFKVMFYDAKFTDGSDALILAFNSQWNPGHLMRHSDWSRNTGWLYFEFMNDTFGLGFFAPTATGTYVSIATPTAGTTPVNKAGNVLIFGFNNGAKAFTSGQIKIYGKVGAE